ncbi:hypothetical protein FQA47_002172 [Oryzias melastigma]|uniref:Integrase core domain-containing protein n=1 Tax=Oryzias melastigma TaxID=30732 RepID=A0A834BXG0_ORYME|nr:hypothetical protein FQA47_002172 [Oryzias melastigma]
MERLWRDLWIRVTCVFYINLHLLEEQHLLDLSNPLHLFCCHYVFLPRLQVNLDTFRQGWDNHPLRTEKNLTPNQLLELGQEMHPVVDPEELYSFLLFQFFSTIYNINATICMCMQIPLIDWESSALVPDPHAEVQVPEFDNPLADDQMELLRENIDPLQSSESSGMDIYLQTLQDKIVKNLRVMGVFSARCHRVLYAFSTRLLRVDFALITPWKFTVYLARSLHVQCTRYVLFGAVTEQNRLPIG